MDIKVVGLDIAKQVFQVHAADEHGRAVAQLRLRRSQVLEYFKTLPPAWLAWRLARLRTTGHGN